MNKQTSSPSKGRMRCNACREVTSPKAGDWFLTPNSTGQQIFLCKDCEASLKREDYKRANAARL